MRLIHGFGLSLFALTASTLGVTPAARACSGFYCATPSGFAVPDGGVVPENLGELTVFFNTPDAVPRGGEFSVKVHARDDPATLLVSGDTKGSASSTLSLGTLLKQGKSYVVEATPLCPFATQAELLAATATTTLHVGPPSEVPTTLGPLTLVRSGMASVPMGDSGGGCWEDHSANVADVALDAAALPAAWRPLITNYQLIVDGEPFNWSMTIGARAPTDSPAAFYLTAPREFRAWTLCEDPNRPGAASVDLPLFTGVSPGKHTLWVRARVPGNPATVIESDKLDVQVRCPFCVDSCGRPPEPAAPPRVGVETGPSDPAAPAQEPAPGAAKPRDDDDESQNDDASEMRDDDDAERAEKSAAGCSAAQGKPGENEASLLLSMLITLLAMSRLPRRLYARSRL